MTINIDQIRQLVGAAIGGAKLLGADSPAFQKVTSALGAVLGGAPGAAVDPAVAAEALRLNKALGEAEAARRAASSRMRDAGSYRPPG